MSLDLRSDSGNWSWPTSDAAIGVGYERDPDVIRRSGAVGLTGGSVTRQRDAASRLAHGHHLAEPAE